MSASIDIRPKGFDQFIGQSRVKEILKVAVQAARIRGTVLPHVLLCGPPGVGKTSLAYILANELAVGISTSSGPMLDRGLIKVVRSMKRGQLLFVDEIHRLRTEYEELLYPILEDFELHLTFGSKLHRVPLERFSFVAATTREGDLSAPLRSRFNLVLHLDSYTIEELALIVQRSARLLNSQIDDAGAEEIARRSRNTPRLANNLLFQVCDLATVRRATCITRSLVQEASTMVGVDSHGLSSQDRRLLQVVARSGAIGLNALSSALNEEQTNIEDNYEPYLIQAGFLNRTKQGRTLTPAGYSVLAAR